MPNNNQVRRALINAIKEVKPRPLNMNFPNESAKVQTKELPYMDCFFLSERLIEEFMDGETRSQLVQIDIYMEKGKDLKLMDGYKDAFQKHFAKGNRFDGFTALSTPEVLSQGEIETAFAVQLSFEIEYEDFD